MQGLPASLPAAPVGELSIELPIEAVEPGTCSKLDSSVHTSKSSPIPVYTTPPQGLIGQHIYGHTVWIFLPVLHCTVSHFKVAS